MSLIDYAVIVALNLFANKRPCHLYQNVHRTDDKESESVSLQGMSP